jgi:hypothetical protein
MPKILVPASVSLLMLGTAAAMAKGDAENVGGATSKRFGKCCSQFQIILADQKVPDKGRPKRSVAEDYDPATSPTRKCGNKVCVESWVREGSTGPTRPPKPTVGSQK